nr:integrase, catalytic region, zinc finger, CCHC-type, peptidase aspartic, catalytic [Tanacetum cinerariifolium]
MQSVPKTVLLCLTKENYVSWSSRLLRYAKRRPNGKLIYNSIKNGPYVRRMIPEPCDKNRKVTINKTFHEQTDDELTEKELKQEKKDKLFNEWERFTSADGESIESYYHRFSKLMNDFKRNKRFPEKIANNLKFLNNLQPEWSRHVTIVHQTKDLHTADYTQLYDFMKYNQKEVVELRVERLAKTHDPLALMENSNNPINYPMFHPDQPSLTRAKGNAIGNNGNQIRCYNYRGLGHPARNYIVRPKRKNKASTSGTQTDKALVYDSDGSAKYTELLEPIPEPHQVHQNDSNVISEVSSMEQGGGTVDQHHATVEETRAYFESLYNYLAIKVKKVNLTNRKIKETNADLTTKLGVNNIAKTRRPQPRSNTKNDRVPSESKNSCIKNKEVEVEEHPKNLLLSKNKKHMSFESNNIKLTIRNDKSEVVFAMCYLNLFMVHRLELFQALKLLINFVLKFLGIVRFGNDHVAAILGFSDLQWENILITMVYFVEGLGHNLFSIGKFCDSDLEDVDELETQQQHAQQQENQASLQPKTVADNVPNAMFDGNTFVIPFATPSTSAAESSSL